MRFSEFSETYGKTVSRKRWIILAVTVLALIAGFLEIGLGPYDLGLEGYHVLWQHLIGDPVDSLDDYVIWQRSAPRAVTVVVVGAGLGVCGAAMQSALKNPLADPYMTGISSGANFGVTLAAVLGVAVAPMFGTYFMSGINAFIFAMIPAIAIIGISSLKKSAGPTLMILIGIAITYMFGGFTTMIKLTASAESFSEVFEWALGSVGSVTWETAPYILAASVFGIIVLYYMHAQLNLLALNENMAHSTGLKPKNARILAIGVSSLVTALLVCFTGTIGFVGLVAPHVMRVFLGSDNRYLVPASAACGALMLAASDCLAIEITMTGLPVGVITALVGGPLFIYLLIRQHKSVWM